MTRTKCIRTVPQGKGGILPVQYAVRVSRLLNFLVSLEMNHVKTELGKNLLT